MKQVLFTTVFLTTLILAGCGDPEVQAGTTQSSEPAPTEVKKPEGEPEKTDHTSRVPKGKYVTIHRGTGEPLHIKVELAQTESERVKGLMFRKHLPSKTGMLFLMDRVANHRFWMKNTLIPLDIIFIAPDGEIVGIVERAEPKTLTGREVGVPSKFILEIPGGESQTLKITPGLWVDLSGALQQ